MSVKNGFKNMKTWDRVIRLVLAAWALSLYFLGTVTGFPGIGLLILTGILVLTSFVGFCPLYSVYRACTSRKGRCHAP